MPKRSLKVHSALENLGQHAKKRKFSAQADKVNKCPTVDTTIPVLASHHEYRPDIQLPVVTKEALDIPMEDQSDSSSDSSDSDLDCDLNSNCNNSELNWDAEVCTEIEHGPSEGYEMFEGAVHEFSAANTENFGHGDMAHISPLPKESPGEKEFIFPWHSIDACTPPSLDSARLALQDLKNLLHPPHNKGH
ncbi:hypothetical protein EDB19DRAFT_1827994 [Suillus lakei]|nr:hypothetical protein EDB19DRAFT_1827994 [Suillus lakei]